MLKIKSLIIIIVSSTYIFNYMIVSNCENSDNNQKCNKGNTRMLQSNSENQNYRYVPKYFTLYIDSTNPSGSLATNLTNQTEQVLQNKTISELEKINNNLNNQTNSTDLNKLKDDILLKTNDLIDQSLYFNNTNGINKEFDKFSVNLNKGNLPNNENNQGILTNQTLINEAKKKNQSIMDMTECEIKIANTLNLSEVIRKQIDLKSTTNITFENKTNSNQIVFSLHRPDTGEIIDVKKICAGTHYLVLYPYIDQNVNIDEFFKFKKQNGNILNINDIFYTDPCTVFINSTDKTQLTFEQRNKIANFKKTINCGTNCVFQDFDSNNFTICNCTIVGDEPNNSDDLISSIKSLLSYKVVESSFTIDNLVTNVIFSFSQTNSKLFKCYEDAFNSTIIPTNYGFWAGLMIVIIPIITYLFITLSEDKSLKAYNNLVEEDLIIFCNLIDRQCMEELQFKRTQSKMFINGNPERVGKGKSNSHSNVEVSLEKENSNNYNINSEYNNIINDSSSIIQKNELFTTSIKKYKEKVENEDDFNCESPSYRRKVERSNNMLDSEEIQIEINERVSKIQNIAIDFKEDNKGKTSINTKVHFLDAGNSKSGSNLHNIHVRQSNITIQSKNKRSKKMTPVIVDIYKRSKNQHESSNSYGKVNLLSDKKQRSTDNLINNNKILNSNKGIGNELRLTKTINNMTMDFCKLLIINIYYIINSKLLC